MGINKKIVETEAEVAIEKFEVIGPWSGNSNQNVNVATSFPVDYVFHRETGYSSHSGYSGQSVNLLNEFAQEGTWVQNNSDRVGFGNDYLNFRGNWARNNYSGYYGFCFASSRTGVTNTDGTITSTVWANDDAGFSFVRWNGNDSTGSVGHGLSQAPDVVWVYPQDYGDEITVATPFDSSFGPPYFLYLTLNNYSNYGADKFPSNPSSTVINLGAYNNGNDYSNGCTAACWYEKSGYSYFRRYEGTCGGGTKTINMGFEPAGVIIKSFSYTYPWKFVSYSGQHGVTFTSTGISMPNNQTYVNQCANYFIMAWANA